MLDGTRRRLGLAAIPSSSSAQTRWLYWRGTYDTNWRDVKEIRIQRADAEQIAELIDGEVEFWRDDESRYESRTLAPTGEALSEQLQRIGKFTVVVER